MLNYQRVVVRNSEGSSGSNSSSYEGSPFWDILGNWATINPEMNPKLAS